MAIAADEKAQPCKRVDSPILHRTTSLHITDKLHKIEVIKQILGNAHCKDISGWAARIQKVMAKAGAISLVDLWLGLPIIIPSSNKTIDYSRLWRNQ
jgi:hypothetical protein